MRSAHTATSPTAAARSSKTRSASTRRTMPIPGRYADSCAAATTCTTRPHLSAASRAPERSIPPTGRVDEGKALHPGLGASMSEPRFGVFLIPDAEEPGRTVERALTAEQLGLDLVGIQDHPYQRRFLDAFSLLTFIAGRTERIRLA